MKNNNQNNLQTEFKIRVIAPSGSFNKISSNKDSTAERMKKEFGMTVDFGSHCMEVDLLNSSSVRSRIDDLHEAFTDKSIKAIICATGGYNSNDLLPYIDWKLIKNNPKPLIGSSDITVLLNAIYAKTGIRTYFGPNFYKFGMKLGLEYTVDYFKKCLLSFDQYLILPSDKWSEDKWYKNQEERKFITNEGYVVCNPGVGKGKIIGGNLCSFNLLQGTKYMPSLRNTILCIEDDDLSGENTFGEFYRNLQSLLQQPGADSIRGIMIGRFLSNCSMTLEKINFLIKDNINLKKIPVIANVDFGHTDPTVTFPIGGTMKIFARGKEVKIEVLSR